MAVRLAPRFSSRSWVNLVAAGLVVATAGCGSGQPAAGGAPPAVGGPLPTVGVALPRHPTAGRDVVLAVRLTQAGAPYNRADDVMFEIWKDVSGAKHTLLHAKRTGDGLYTAHYRFPSPGNYKVIYHVVAAGNMIMAAPRHLTVTK
ncbi:MAG: FixH family protein [Alicyclobacillaceae bacterium]|nr:FixH family protein [Alicyclobacillaceae bacterium]